MSIDLNIEYQADAAIIRFTRPEIRNPLSVAVLDHLHSIVDDLASKSGLDRVIFTGSDGVFASGANLNEIAAVTPETAKDFARYGQTLMSKICALPQITIAAVNGFCFGGALDLALSCNKRIGSPKAQFAHPGAGLGIITGWGGTQRLTHLIGRANALEMFFTAAPIGAERACAIGLIDEIHLDPFERALEKGFYDR